MSGGVGPSWQVWSRGEDEVGEGPVWLPGPQRLLWVDITRGLIMSSRDGSRRCSLAVGQWVGAAAPTTDGRLVVAARDGFGALDAPATHDRHDVDASGRGPVGGPPVVADPVPPRWLAPVLRDRPGERFNDAEVDLHGRWWAGSTTVDLEPGRGALWVLRRTPDAQVAAEQVMDDLTLPNGLDFTDDGRTLYLADSEAGVVHSFDVDLGNGSRAPSLSGRAPVFRLGREHGVPDGLTLDADGCLWLAVWGGGRVVRLTPDGEELMALHLPVDQVSSCVFGGPHLTDLFVTTARRGLTAGALAGQPLAGSVFRFPDVGQGRPGRTFG